MSNDPGSMWGKLAMITAFITALAGLGTTLKQCSDDPPAITEAPYSYDLAPQQPPAQQLQPQQYQPQNQPLPQQQPYQSGLFCCDIYNIKQCQIVINPGPLGSPCWCSNVPGTGTICQ